MTENTQVTTINVPEAATQDIQNEEKRERMFTQKELEEKISERLGRERRINESLASVKKLLKSFSQKGLVSSVSYADMAKELIEKLKGADSGAEHKEDALVQKADVPCANTDAVADADGRMNVKANDGNYDEDREKGEDFVKVLSRIKAKYPDGEAEKMLTGDSFERFARGRSGSIEEIFDDYYEFVSCISGKSENTQSANLSSTAFSSHSGYVSPSGLTEQQMEIAKSAGMSYREYSDLLESIPKRGQRIKV